jgi:hypothetical protein
MDSLSTVVIIHDMYIASSTNSYVIIEDTSN